ncbi:MAG TPA: iron-sulfur cluster carrier protein ApbC, partial [Hyphomicrobiales bacterium]|nr:iron-sulfur cluster carrier protein ApbC [Hyphomicrobiales bacterium]
MSEVTKEQVLNELRRVKGPDLKGDIVELGIVSDVVINEGKVYFSISVDPARVEELEPMRQAAEKVVSDIPGIKQVLVSLTAHAAAGANGGGRQESPVSSRPRGAAGPGTDVPPPMASQAARIEQSAQQKPGVPGVNAIIAVASGKGGVGKSTTAANLALALQANGLKVGVLDADIYGPSMPRLLGVSGRPEAVGGRVLKPLDGYGMKVMSMGFLVEEDTPMVWRGPMVMSALTQMLREVAWGELDILVVDMPPGTGDAQLTMAQRVPLAGAVIVSTPQDIALLDARKALNMFRKVDVPVLGIIENMSYVLCPSCGHRAEIFSHGGARRTAEKFGVDFLGEIPLDLMIREETDAGRPPVVSHPDGPQARAYLE